jgi:hypothetical protein
MKDRQHPIKPAVPNLFIDRAKFLNKKALRAKKGT